MKFAILPDACHYQDYDRSMLYPPQSGSEECVPSRNPKTAQPQSPIAQRHTKCRVRTRRRMSW